MAESLVDARFLGATYDKGYKKLSGKRGETTPSA